MASVLNVLRPAALLRLQIRFEDFTQPGDDDADTPSEASPYDGKLKQLRQAEASQQRALGTLTAQWMAGRATQTDLDNAQRGLKKTRANIKRLEKEKDQTRGGGAGDDFSATVITVPMELDAELNSYRTLDTLSFKLPFKDAPLESLNIRSCLVEAYLGTVAAEDFATRGRWSLPLDKSTIVFRGYVDDWKTHHDEEDATVSASCRSLECVLVDQKLDARSSLLRVKGGGEKISEFVNRVLQGVPATSGRHGGDQLKAIFFGTQEPTLSQKDLLRVLQTAKSRAQAAGAAQGAAAVVADSDQGSTADGQVKGSGNPRLPAGQSEMTAWNLIIQACALVGCVPSYDPSARATVNGNEVQGDFIAIRPPKTIYANQQEGMKVEGGGDGFVRRLPAPSATGAAILRQSQVRFMVWGRNIAKFDTSRKLGRVKVPAVEVIGYNPDASPLERTIKVRFPPNEKGSKRRTRVSAKGTGASEEVVRRLVYGNRNKSQLLDIAESLYHAIGRNELEVDIETEEMASYFDPNEPDTAARGAGSVDMLALRHGTPVRVLVARQVRELDPIGGVKRLTISPLSEVFERRTDELRKFLTEQVGRWNPSLNQEARQAQVEAMADKMANVIKAARREDFFYVRKVRHRWASEDGYSCGVQLVNYVEARNAPRNLGVGAKEQDKKFRKTAATDRTPGAAEVARARVLASQGKT